MQRISFSSIAAVLVTVLASCRSAPQSATTSAPESRHDLDLRGDFQGPLGVQLYSVRDAIAKDVPGTLARVRALGFREVELAGTYGLSASQFRAELDRAGLRATSMHVGYERLRDSLRAVLDEARILGVRYVGTAWIPHNDGPLTEEGARRAAADFNAWGRSAQQLGLQFFYHVHGYEFQPGPSGALPMDILMRETAPDAVKFEMDVFWISRPGADPVAWLRKYPARWRLLHLKDMKQGTATNVNTGSANPDETEVPLGTGQIDYRGVLRAAREIGVEKYFVEDETREPFATMPLTVRWLETLRY
jgi:sugar phosphate isomerase/epimerase